MSAAPETRRALPDASREGLLAAGIRRLVGYGDRAIGRSAETARGLQSVVTRVGWCVAIAAAASLAAGYTWGWRELIALGWGLAIVFAVALLWLVGRGAAAIRLELSTPRVMVGDRAEARITAENPGRQRVLGMLAELQVGDRRIERAIPALARGTSLHAEVSIPTSRRGVVAVGPVRSVRADPIGVVRREIVWTGAHTLHIHPRVVPIEALSSGFVRDLEGSPTKDLTASDIAFHALREYLPGDDRRHIHWRSSAKTGTFMVRQFEETRRSRLMVVLDLDPAAYVDAEEFELAVSAAASVGVRAIRDARNLAFLVSGLEHHDGRTVELPTVSRDRLLDALCLVEVDERAAPIEDVARAGGETMSGLSLVVLVSGSGRGVTALRAAAARLPAAVETLAVRCSPEGTATARQVGGLTVFGIGYLEDLRAMLARSSRAA
ncbi:DUF58 domain-containing protein [Agromyces sp. MMS24-JH15]|uniref:DUF58 domain-containing protein n=1 Tax=Agromyces sp. MMS24-JH15 TaxID=3243765 RepID=UPI003749E000